MFVSDTHTIPTLLELVGNEASILHFTRPVIGLRQALTSHHGSLRCRIWFGRNNADCFPFLQHINNTRKNKILSINYTVPLDFACPSSYLAMDHHQKIFLFHFFIFDLPLILLQLLHTFINGIQNFIPNFKKFIKPKFAKFNGKI
jgi:hypothetical protein